MSFLEKKFKRVGAEGVEELMDALKVDEKLRAVAKAGGSISYYSKNEDGTYNYTAEFGDKKISNTFPLGEFVDQSRPDGVIVKSKYELSGDTLTQIMIDPATGNEVKFVREYGVDKMTMTITAAGTDAVGKLFYDAV